RRRGETAGSEVLLQFGQLVAQVERGLIALRGILGEAVTNDSSELAGNVLRDVRRERWRVFQDRREEQSSRVALERPLSGRELVEDDAQREDVAAVIDRLALHLFGRHIAQRADDRP